jgi:hypothetical protein
MKTKEEIKNRISELDISLDQIQEWIKQAEKRYNQDKAWWGKQADRGEVMAANDEYSNILQEKNILLWVLNQTKQV